MNYNNLALLFKALSDETRLKIIEMVKEKELCACEILENLSITQPTLSYHMKILADSKLVNLRKDGSWMRYKLNETTLNQINIFLDNKNSKRG